MVLIEFVIPNRDDAAQRPTLYVQRNVEVVPREGEGIEFVDAEDEPVSIWRVKSVTYRFLTEAAASGGWHVMTPQAQVRLIEPDHWTQQ